MSNPDLVSRVAPIRVQLSRKKGWKMPPNTVKVDRSTKNGNPFQIKPTRRRNKFSVIRGGIVIATLLAHKDALAMSIRCFERDIAPTLDMRALVGKNLACWCPLDQPCHADVLLDLANPPSPKAPSPRKDLSNVSNG